MPEPTTDRAHAAPAGELSYRVYSLADLDAKLGSTASLRRTRYSTISPHVVSVPPHADPSRPAHEMPDLEAVPSLHTTRVWGLAAHVAGGAAAAMFVLGTFLLLGNATDDVAPVRSARAETAIVVAEALGPGGPAGPAQTVPIAVRVPMPETKAAETTSPTPNPTMLPPHPHRAAFNRSAEKEIFVP